MSPVPPIVFLGPTLPVADAVGVLDADYRPPVELGDVWRAVQEGPSAIAIVDGYFHAVPAVWHREILFAMSRGIPVYGASSMGALRAGELASFGMRPVGPIALGYADGTLVADDEVVLSHASAEHDYRAFSIPLVNVRATIDAGVAGSVLDQASAIAMLDAARSLFYPDRCWPAILNCAAIDSAARERFEAWLPRGAVDQKRADALELLALLALDVAARRGPIEPPTCAPFPATALWVELVTRETPWAALREELALLGLDVTVNSAALARGEIPVPVDVWQECWRRAHRKRTAESVEAAAAWTDEDALLDWFFGDRLGWPDDLDEFLRRRGWTDPAVVLAVAAREASYLGLIPDVTANSGP